MEENSKHEEFSTCLNTATNDVIIEDKTSIATCLEKSGETSTNLDKSSNCSITKNIRKRVTFIEEVSTIDYKQPVWKGVIRRTTVSLINEYRLACSFGNVTINDIITKQLMKIQDNCNYSAVLNLNEVKIDADIIYILEIIFKLSTFQKLYLNTYLSTICHLQEIFEIILYYDPITEIIITGWDEDLPPWKRFKLMISNNNLNSITFNNMILENRTVVIIFEKIYNSPNIKSICFNNCEIRASTFTLAKHLKLSKHLQAVHLCSANLYDEEAALLAEYLPFSSSLKVLNLNKNKIGNNGLELLSKGLIKQAENSLGIVVLMLSSNELTQQCSSSLAAIIHGCKRLHTLDIGKNNLTDHLIFQIINPIKNSKLETLGLMSTLLTSEGLYCLAKAMTNNNTLYFLNVQNNMGIQEACIKDLCDLMSKTPFLEISIDVHNTCAVNSKQYSDTVLQLQYILSLKRNAPPYNNLSLDEFEMLGKKYTFDGDIDNEVKISTVKQSYVKNSSEFEGSMPETNIAKKKSPINRFVVEPVTISSPIYFSDDTSDIDNNLS